jgi:hypothetical protein
MVSDPASSASETLRTGIKTHSSPAAFRQSSPSLFLPPLSRCCTGPPSCLRHLRAPCSPSDRYDVASERNAAVWPPALIRLTPQQYCLVSRLTVRRPLAIKLMKAPGIPAGRGRLGHGTALDAEPLLPSFTPRQPIYHTSSRLHRGRQRHISTLIGRVTPASSFCQSSPRLVLSRKEMGGT